MHPPTRTLVDDYLDRLEVELADLPAARRRELVAEIEEHIAEAQAELDDPTEADVLTLLDRIGDPSDIAAEARERLDLVPPQQPRRRRLEIVALVCLLPGSLLFPIGWIVAIVLVWLSDVWTTRDKWIATLLPPGGLGAALVFSSWGAFGGVESCSGGSTTDGREFYNCTGGPSETMRVVGILITVFLLITPFITTAYLGRRLKRDGRARPHAA